MRLSEFRYALTKSAIATVPKEPRDKCKMMVLDRRKKSITDAVFTDILDYLQKGDVLVLNDTKVFPAKLYGHKEKTSAKIEVFLLRELNKRTGLWDVLVEPARKVRVGNKIYFPEDLVAEVVDNTTSRGRTIRFLNPDVDIFQIVERIGHMPFRLTSSANLTKKTSSAIKPSMRASQAQSLHLPLDCILPPNC